jgi:TetR/AcrR family transcriptional regulator
MPPEKSDSSAARKRSRILEAAYEVCARRGVEGARMDEVAALAQVSKGTLYHYFESKQDLFLAALIDSYEESLRILDTARDGASEQPLVRLDQILEGMTKVLAAMATRMTVHYQSWGVVAGDASARERLYGFLANFFAERSATISEVICDGQRRGDFAAEVDAAAVTDGIMALLSGFLYRATFDPEHADPERLNACFDALIRDAFYTAPPASGRGASGRGEADRA